MNTCFPDELHLRVLKYCQRIGSYRLVKLWHRMAHIQRKSVFVIYFEGLGRLHFVDSMSFYMKRAYSATTA